MATSSANPPSSGLDTAFFGHPRGLSTLFFTEMWERFSYYGIRALLILYMTASAEQHGLGLGVAIAGAIYGLYTSCAYIFALPSGWIADRFLGHQNAVIFGGLLIAAGNFGLMLPSLGTFIASLLVMAIGTSFLKTSCTTVVGFLYAEKDRRRDSGFTLYYVGINLGAGLAPLICGYVGQNIDFRYAFGLAGLFMLVGLTQFSFTRGNLGTAGRGPAVTATPTDSKVLGIGSFALFGTLAALFFLQVSIERVADGFAALLLIAVLLTFGGLILSKDFSPVEKKRIYVILVLFVASALFWSIFEQAGSTLNLFADRSTANSLFGMPFPSSWFQSLNPIYIYALGPLLAWLWIKLGDRNPSPVTKFSFGLLGAGGGFLLMTLAALAAGDGGKVSPLWLAAVYLIHTVAELCLSPVGLSAITKLAPARIAGLTMGVWFLSISVGNFFAGRMASFYESMPLETLVGYAGATGVAFGLLLLLISKPVTGLMGGVK
ncbi:MAG: peptide MFS transporter [Acidobacteriota bacterium]